jgi:hypothetical protein
MADPQAATLTQLRNIQLKTGERRSLLMDKPLPDLGDSAPAPVAGLGDPLDSIYTGAKAALRPLHGALMKRIEALGAFEQAPKKSYISLRRKKQFAMLGPATQSSLELGLNAKDLPAASRLRAMQPGGMCQYTVRISGPAEIDAQLLAWIEAAYSRVLKSAVFVVTAIALQACGGGGGGGSGSPNNSVPDGVVGTGPGILSASPLDLSTLVAATPLGMLAPPGHVLPTDHVYLSFVDSTLPPSSQDCTARNVYAAGGGVVSFVLQTEAAGDTKVMVQMTKTFYYYYDHVLLLPGVKVGSKVSAGERIATTTGRCPSMDLGVYDLDVNPPGFLNPTRYGELGAHPASPYKYFTEPLRTSYYAKVRLREGIPIDKDGRLDWGAKGRLSGDWFHTSLPANANSAGPDGWPKTVSFAYDWLDQSPKISIGGTIASPLVLSISKTDLDPTLVMPASGVQAYRDTPSGPQNRAGWVLVQMLANDRIKIEYFTGEIRPIAFTAAAQEFIR